MSLIQLICVACVPCSTTGDLLRVANLTIQDAFYAHKLMFELNILPLAWQITTICGNVLVSSLYSML